MPHRFLSTPILDDAAVYCIAHSIITEAKDIDDNKGFDFSEGYNGWDGLMREAMRVARVFENWATEHVDFNNYSGVWPYEMEVHFGETFFDLIEGGDLVTGCGCLSDFDESMCPVVAEAMELKLVQEPKPKVAANSIFTIQPYCNCGVWMFDDETVNLKSEAFVSGADTFIDLMLDQKGIKNGEKGFVLQFSATEFPDHDAKLTWQGGDMNNIGAGGGVFGNDYLHEATGHNLWLCPALFCYFEKAPAQLFVKVTEKTKTKRTVK